PADGSQIEAVRWAAAGKSFILEGPPGTGKSQTITNLIAHCLAEGKKVLFVAEKQAALDVVKKRLDSVGLGALSLDLHGKNQTVNAVREQIREALDLQVPASSSWETMRSSYRTLVESLARYPHHLHEIGPADMSAWDARQVLLELEEVATTADPTSFDVPRGLVMGQVSLTDLYEAARDLGNALLDLGISPDQSAWRLAGPTDPASLDRQAVGRALDELRAADQDLTHPAVRAATALARTSDGLRAVAGWSPPAEARGGEPQTRPQSSRRHGGRRRSGRGKRSPTSDRLKPVDSVTACRAFSTWTSTHSPAARSRSTGESSVRRSGDRHS